MGQNSRTRFDDCFESHLTQTQSHRKLISSSLKNSAYMRVTPAWATGVWGVKEKVKERTGVNLMGENCLLVSLSLYFMFPFPYHVRRAWYSGMDNAMNTDTIETNECTDSQTVIPANWPEANPLSLYPQKTAAQASTYSVWSEKAYHIIENIWRPFNGSWSSSVSWSFHICTYLTKWGS